MVKKRRGDRKDAELVRDINPMNAAAAFLMPRKVESELHICETIDVGPILDYVMEKKTEKNNITFFNTTMAALVRLIALRPVLNRFVKNNKFFQRNSIEMGYVAKVSMDDEAVRAIHRTSFLPGSTVFEIAERLTGEIKKIRTGKMGGSNRAVEKLVRYPHFMKKIIMKTLRWLDVHGWAPESIIKTDPNFSTVFVSNVGSINANAPSHHLNEWGTNSIFLCIGKIYEKNECCDDGTIIKRRLADFTFALDERIADGFYYSKSFAMFRDLMANPAQLETAYVPDNSEPIKF